MALLPEDPILSLPKAFQIDPRSFKVNLGIGVYLTSEGHSLVLNCIRKAESLLAQKHLLKDYAPIEGDPEYIRVAPQVLFGVDSPILNPETLFVAQTIGGSSALRLGGEFIASNLSKSILMSQPSWINHKLIFEKSGLNVGSYPYLNEDLTGIDFNAMKLAIKNTPPGTVLLLQASCHNPTGFDPSFEEWKELSDLMKKQQLIPFFDCAYQGLGDGIIEDVRAVRYFAEQGHDMLVAYSFSKNIGLYGERLGYLAIISQQKQLMPAIASQVKVSIRGNYSNPPIHSPRLLTTVLKSPELYIEWETELKNMRDRILEMRNAFIAALMIEGHNGNFYAMHKQKGLFSLCGLSPEQVLRLREEKAIYLPSNGRINIAGLNTNNMEYVAQAIVNVTK